jgi:hypothetical protein
MTPPPHAVIVAFRTVKVTAQFLADQEEQFRRTIAVAGRFATTDPHTRETEANVAMAKAALDFLSAARRWYGAYGLTLEAESVWEEG